MSAGTVAAPILVRIDLNRLVTVALQPTCPASAAFVAALAREPAKPE